MLGGEARKCVTDRYRQTVGSVDGVYLVARDRDAMYVRGDCKVDRGLVRSSEDRQACPLAVVVVVVAAEVEVRPIRVQ